MVATIAAAMPRRRPRVRPAAAIRTAGYYALVCLAMLPTVFVFYWMVTLSLKTQVEAAGYPPHFFRFAKALQGYFIQGSAGKIFYGRFIKSCRRQ